MAETLTVALVGNPNSGKTTVFNALTGARQMIGNWPGVTVERKEGHCRLPDGTEIVVIDLPGIYSLMPSSEDERVAVEYAMERQADLFINVIDGANLERNLYLSLLLAELKVPTLHLLTMMDIAAEQNTVIDLRHLENHLGAPVAACDVRQRGGVGELLQEIQEALANPIVPGLAPAYPEYVEEEIARLLPRCAAASSGLGGAPPRWLAIQLLEASPAVVTRMTDTIGSEELVDAERRIMEPAGEFSDEAFASARYAIIQGLCADVVRRRPGCSAGAAGPDRWILNRGLGIPIFLAVMFAVFWVTQVVGGAFVDFFDLLGGTLFAETPRFILGRLGAPRLVIVLLADGLGAGLQTMATFLPPIGCMFLCLAILEDSGYMARAAFVMDRAMGWVGLPGKSFVPLLVGFGCSVPAIMATRTLESRRDRMLTIFMTPFMSCGAKLPVYVIFGAAFFPDNPGRSVFLIYVTGIVLGILTGLLLKRTLFTGAPSHFIMELPPYHRPRLRSIMMNVWERLRMFAIRAGKVIVPMVLVLGVLNSVGLDGSLGRTDSGSSLLSGLGRTMTPVFEPMGVGRENWPATVAIFSGLFAKEAVIGTLNSLYGQNRRLAEGEAGALESEAAVSEFDFMGGIAAAFRTLPVGLAKIAASVTVPLGLAGTESGGMEPAAMADGADASLFADLRRGFPQGANQAFAYLLFILLYIPCFAAMGAAFNELGRLYGIILMVYLTVLGWSVATLYYQLTLGRQWLWIAVPCALLAAMAGGFALMGRYRRIPLR